VQDFEVWTTVSVTNSRLHFWSLIPLGLSTSHFIVDAFLTASPPLTCCDAEVHPTFPSASHFQRKPDVRALATSLQAKPNKLHGSPNTIGAIVGPHLHGSTAWATAQWGKVSFWGNSIDFIPYSTTVKLRFKRSRGKGTAIYHVLLHATVAQATTTSVAVGGASLTHLTAKLGLVGRLTACLPVAREQQHWTGSFGSHHRNPSSGRPDGRHLRPRDHPHHAACQLILPHLGPIDVATSRADSCKGSKAMRNRGSGF